MCFWATSLGLAEESNREHFFFWGSQSYLHRLQVQGRLVPTSPVLHLLSQVTPCSKTVLQSSRKLEWRVIYGEETYKESGQILGDAPEEVRLRNVPASMLKTVICLSGGWGEDLLPVLEVSRVLKALLMDIRSKGRGKTHCALKVTCMWLLLAMGLSRLHHHHGHSRHLPGLSDKENVLPALINVSGFHSARDVRTG